MNDLLMFIGLLSIALLTFACMGYGNPEPRGVQKTVKRGTKEYDEYMKIWEKDK